MYLKIPTFNRNLDLKMNKKIITTGKNRRKITM
jgi:hypothetical protein